MLIEQGEVRMRGDVKSVVGAFVKMQPGAQGVVKGWMRTGTGEARIVTARLLDASGDGCAAFLMGETLVLEMDVEFRENISNANFTVEVNRKEMGLRVLDVQTEDSGFAIQQIQTGMRRFRVEIPNCMLYPTSYEITICIWVHGKTIDHVDGIVGFSMIQSDVTRRTTALTIHREAIYYAPSVWTDVPLG